MGYKNVGREQDENGFNNYDGLIVPPLLHRYLVSAFLHVLPRHLVRSRPLDTREGQNWVLPIIEIHESSILGFPGPPWPGQLVVG